MSTQALQQSRRPMALAAVRWVASQTPLTSLWLWLALNGIDALQTWLALSMGAWEANPLLSSTIHAVGIGPAMAVKLAIALAIGALLFRDGRLRLCSLLNGAMVGVIGCNLVTMALST